MKQDLSLRQTEPIFERIRKHEGQRVSKRCTLFFCAILLACIAVESVLMMILGRIFGETEHETLQNLFLTVIETTAVILFCRLGERRPLRTMGIRKTKVIRDYLVGVVLGVGMFAAVVGIACLFGTMQNNGAIQKISWGMIAVYLCGWLLQGFSEEILCRGFLLSSFGVHQKPWSAVIGSSIVFAVLHLGNDNISGLAIINLTLFGIFAGILYLRTDSIWMVAALHSLWNFAQGNLFGIEVSGMQIPVNILQFQADANGKWINGGAFGVEGGLATTIVFAIGIIMALLWKQRDASEM